MSRKNKSYQGTLQGTLQGTVQGKVQEQIQPPLEATMTRRQLLAFGAGAGALAMNGSFPFSPAARGAAGTKPKALLVIFTPGGYNAIFGSAQSFMTTGGFGVTAQNTIDLTPTAAVGSKLIVDSVWAPFSPFVKANMAAVGVNHGISAHGGAKAAQFTTQGKNGLLLLADTMGGSAPIKCAAVGAELPYGPTAAVNGTSIQQINDMQATISALGGGAPDPTMPKRDLAAAGIQGSADLSATVIAGNKGSLVTLDSGYQVAKASLLKPAQPFNPAELMTGYNLTSTAVTNFASKMAAAELMIRTGTNVVVAVDGAALSWDTHGDTSGSGVRGKFAANIVPGLKTFSDRMVNDTSPIDVNVVIFGDFARSLPGSNHSPCSVATVFGPSVKLGTTGVVVPTNVTLAAGTPGIDGLYGLLAALSGVPAMAPNPHTALVK